MGLFFISLICVLTFAFFTANTLDFKNRINNIIYFMLAAFANIVLTFEILSIFSAITEACVIVFNLILLCLSYVFWNRRGRHVIKFGLREILKSFTKALVKDKYLLILTICFVFMCTVSLLLISFMPVVNCDAEAYHVLRSLFWVSNHNLNHFTIADARALQFPINSEILYAWVLLFVKKDLWFGIFSFSGFVMSITALFGVLSNIGFSLRKKLWVVLLTSSFASVIGHMSGTETDIIISGLVLSSIYLFWNALKSGEKIHMFMAALSYALAIGTKTPAILLIPGVGIFMTAISIYYKKKDFYKPLLLFIGLGLLNFILFAAYNYILNFIDYGNIAGSQALLSAHRNHNGIKSVAADFVKYIFMFFDFTGFTWNKTFGVFVMNIRDSILSSPIFFNPVDGIYSSDSTKTNSTLIEPLMGLGILGFLVYLPCWIMALIRPFFTRCRKDWFLFGFAGILFITILTMSYMLQYMTYSIRFLTSFCVVSAPVIAYSYCKKNNPAKFIIVFFAVFYMVFASTSLWARPANRIFKYFKAGATVSEVREIAKCSGFLKKARLKNYIRVNPSCEIRDKILSFDKRNKILYFPNSAESLLLVKMLQFNGYDIDFGLAENIDNFDISKYNIILTVHDFQESTVINRYDERNSENAFINDGIYCKYADINQKEISRYSKNYPYKSICAFSGYFLRKHGLEQFAQINVPNEKNKEPLILRYKFYNNTQNPLIKP